MRAPKPCAADPAAPGTGKKTAATCYKIGKPAHRDKTVTANRSDSDKDQVEWEKINCCIPFDNYVDFEALVKMIAVTGHTPHY